jgi:C4-dicarboxylate transporter DctM subunit
MNSFVLVGLGLLGMFVLIGMHVPIGIAMAIAGIVGFGLLVGPQPALSLLSSEPAATLASTDLMVIPLFLLMGNFASASGLSSDIYRLAQTFIGHRRGGLSFATIIGCAGFGAVCGSSIATTATMTRVALPEMLKRGYQPGFAAGSIASGGTLGVLIPPSVIMVIYAYLTEQFVITLFVAAVVPSIIAVIFYLIAIQVYVRINPDAAPAGERTSWKERVRAARDAWGAILLLGGIIGGIYGGVFTVNEAAAVGVAFAFAFLVFRGRLTKTVLIDALTDTAGNTAMIYVIVFGASIFSYFVSATRLPDGLVEFIQVHQLPGYAIITILVVMYIVLGCIFDEVAAILITLPFTFPMLLQLGYDPIWWGIILVVTVEIGLIAPPIGLNVFVLHSMANHIPLTAIYRGVSSFLWVDLIRLILLIVFPSLVLTLPRYLGMP